MKPYPSLLTAVCIMGLFSNADAGPRHLPQPRDTSNSSSKVAAQPIEFKGISMGVSQNEFESKLPVFDCYKLPDGFAYDSSCKTTARFFSYAGAPGDAEAGFIRDRLVWINIKFSEQSFPGVRAAVLEKFGPPSSSQTEPVRNRMGGKFMDEILMWRRDGVTLVMERYSSNTTKSQAVFSLDSAVEEITARQRASNSKDL
jgi:hypothetical protein